MTFCKHVSTNIMVEFKMRLAAQTAVHIYLSLRFVWRRNTALKVLVFHKNNMHRSQVYIYMYIYTYICLHHFVIWAENSRASKTLLWVGIKLHTEHQLYPFIHPTAIVITIRVCCGLFHPRESVYMQIQSFQHPWMVSNGNWTCCASTHRKDYLGRGNHQNHLIRCTTFERYTTLVHLDMQVGTRRGVWWSHVSSINRSLCLYYNTSTESTDSTLSSRSKRLGLSAHPSRLGVCKIFFPWRGDGEWRKPKKGDRNWTVQFKNKPVLCMIWQPWYVRNQIHWYWSRHIYLITVKLWHCSEKILQQTSQQTTTWDLVKWSRLTRIILWPVEMPRLTCLWYLEHLDLSCLGILPPVCRKGMNSKATGMPKMCIYILYIYNYLYVYIYMCVCHFLVIGSLRNLITHKAAEVRAETGNQSQTFLHTLKNDQKWHSLKNKNLPAKSCQGTAAHVEKKNECSTLWRG